MALTDPFHEGHLDHLLKASKLGDYLYVMVNKDEAMVAKKGKCYEPLWFRLMMIEAWLQYLKIEGEVIPMVDNDRTCAETLRMIKPDIFVKGGDRIPGSMPLNEIDTCREIGCQIVYGIGEQKNRSSNAGEKE